MDDKTPAATITNDNSKELILFGRDVAKIPCFRNSFLYGIGGGLLTGTLTFLGTSRSAFSTNVGFGTFFCGTIAYWFACRYNYSATKFQYQQLRSAMQKQATFEGTDEEKKINELEDC